MTSVKKPKATLKPGQKWAYVAEVKDAEGNHPVHGSRWWLAVTASNPEGHFSTRKAAQDVLDRSKAHYQGGGKLMGFVKQIAVSAEPKLAQIDWTFVTTWVKGNVVDPKTVPSKYRAQYIDTMQRVALAAYRSGAPVHANSSFRTRAEQQALYAKYLAGGDLAAEPGHSAHELGEAADIQNARNMPKFIREARKLDLIDDVPGEDWHLTNHHRAA